MLGILSCALQNLRKQKTLTVIKVIIKLVILWSVLNILKLVNCFTPTNFTLLYYFDVILSRIQTNVLS